MGKQHFYRQGGNVFYFWGQDSIHTENNKRYKHTFPNGSHIKDKIKTDFIIEK